MKNNIFNAFNSISQPKNGYYQFVLVIISMLSSLERFDSDINVGQFSFKSQRI